MAEGPGGGEREPSRPLPEVPVGPFWKEADWEAATRPPAGAADLAELAVAMSLDALWPRGGGGLLLRASPYSDSWVVPERGDEILVVS